MTRRNLGAKTGSAQSRHDLFEVGHALGIELRKHEATCARYAKEFDTDLTRLWASGFVTVVFHLESASCQHVMRKGIDHKQGHHGQHLVFLDLCVPRW